LEVEIDAGAAEDSGIAEALAAARIRGRCPCCRVAAEIDIEDLCLDAPVPPAHPFGAAARGPAHAPAAFGPLLPEAAATGEDVGRVVLDVAERGAARGVDHHRDGIEGVSNPAPCCSQRGPAAALDAKLGAERTGIAAGASARDPIEVAFKAKDNAGRELKIVADLAAADRADRIQTRLLARHEWLEVVIRQIGVGGHGVDNTAIGADIESAPR